jgi:hypothetical protein
MSFAVSFAIFVTSPGFYPDFDCFLHKSYKKVVLALSKLYQVNAICQHTLLQSGTIANPQQLVPFLDKNIFCLTGAGKCGNKNEKGD